VFAHCLLLQILDQGRPLARIANRPGLPNTVFCFSTTSGTIVCAVHFSSGDGRREVEQLFPSDREHRALLHNGANGSPLLLSHECLDKLRRQCALGFAVSPTIIQEGRDALERERRRKAEEEEKAERRRRRQLQEAAAAARIEQQAEAERRRQLLKTGGGGGMVVGFIVCSIKDAN
jgi:hypothetical protein